ncbi:MAG: Zn-ribbon domain-containing OB-fold protein [Actinomycetes bacterium]|jgi:uncharacterized OB-fold protein|uniref:Unannotated protein n=1 Tax=freshwater metagenome TaxID=449393 RepID=A0A6J6C2B1_9ZZZZ|nr:hypothetical protein [Actinomycetota bacterium]
MTTTPDPRPPVLPLDGTTRLAGTRCAECGLPSLWDPPRCAGCGGRMRRDTFGPDGTVWSSTVVRVPVPGRTPPYALAYVDLDDGPRVLAHVVAGDGVTVRLPPGTRVRLTTSTDDGDVAVQPIEETAS